MFYVTVVLIFFFNLFFSQSDLVGEENDQIYMAFLQRDKKKKNQCESSFTDEHIKKGFFSIRLRKLLF